MTITEIDFEESEQNTTVGQGQENPTGAVPAPEQGQTAAPTTQPPAPPPTAQKPAPPPASPTMPQPAQQTAPTDSAASQAAPPTAGSPAQVDEAARVAALCPGIDLGADDKVPDDETEPSKVLLKSAIDLARAEALKPTAAAADELYANDPAKDASRKALETAYAKAVIEAASGSPSGSLRAKYNLADKKFRLAAGDMRERLATWIKERLEGSDAAKMPIKDVLLAARKVDGFVEGRLGQREGKRDKSAAAAKQWQKAYADWSKPADVMAAMIGEYVDKIDKLNADINTDTNADLAIYTFWFEVAPKHLQLSPVTVTEDEAPGSTDLGDALGDGWKPLWRSGKDRGDGSIFLLDPVKECPLTDHRKAVFACWREAAVEQAKRQAIFTLRPDDAATLKAKRDALITGRAAAVKALLVDPTP